MLQIPAACHLGAVNSRAVSRLRHWTLIHWTCLRRPLLGDQHGQSEVKRGSTVGSVRRPQSPAVGRDDGLTNGETQAQPLFLRREERLENLLELAGIDSSAAI